MIPWPVALAACILVAIATWQFAVFSVRLYFSQRLHAMADTKAWTERTVEGMKLCFSSAGEPETPTLLVSTMVHACADMIRAGGTLLTDRDLAELSATLTDQERAKLLERVRKDLRENEDD